MRFALGFAVGALGSVLSAHARADDLSTIRERVIDGYTAASGVGDADVAAAQAKVVENAQSILPTVRADGSFADVNYATQPTASWSVNTHYARLVPLAQAYTMPGSALYHDPAIIDAVERALTFGATYYCGNAACVTKGSNWWYWQIGVPRNLLPVLLMLDGALDAKLQASLIKALRYHVGDLEHMLTFTGQNLIWCGFNHLRFALLGGGANELKAVQAAFEAVVVINPETLQEGDGIKPDHSFQQHRGLIYTGGYGASFASDVGTYLQLTEGTAFTLSSKARSVLIDYIADGVPWEVMGGYWDPAVMGRGVTLKAPIPDAASARDALVKAALFDTPRQAELQASAKALIAELGKGGLDLMVRAGQVQAAVGPSAMPSGHRHYFSSDQTVHRRSDYYASIKMFSTRTQSGELVNLQGKRGARQSDGHLYLVKTGKEYFSRSLWPAMDWTRLPGITVEQSPTAADDSLGIGQRDFVGGTGDDQNGVSAMAFAPLSSTLTAQKSWFFFDDFLVFLGSEIKATSAYPVETIIEQWPLSTPEQPLLADGATVASGPFDQTLTAQTLEADGLGYYFPESSAVKAQIKDQTGNWNSLGTSSGAANWRFLTLSLQHGVAPKNASFVYAIALRGQDMTAFSKEPPFVVLHNDAKLAAVRAGTKTGVVFWAAGSVEVASGLTVTTDAPSVVWLTDEAGKLTVNAADPAGKPGAINLTVTGDFVSATPLSPGSSVQLAEGAANLTLERASGETQSAELRRPTVNEGGAAGNDAGGATDTGGSARGGSGGSGGVEMPAATPGDGGVGTYVSTPHDSGCGCTVPNGSRGGAEWLGLLALAAVIARRRREQG
jgi:chondroitin AC lyase